MLRRKSVSQSGLERVQGLTEPNTPPLKGFCTASTPLNPTRVLTETSQELMPAIDAATELALELHHDAGMEEIAGVLLPHTAKTANEALGITAHWQSVSQDIDFERKLLLRALLEALPSSAVVLPDDADSIVELDLAPLKVQAILEAVKARKVINLNTAEFRWDVRQPPPKLSWSLMATPGAGSSLAWGGMSKRQLELSLFETLLLALDTRDGDSPIPADFLPKVWAHACELQGMGKGSQLRSISSLQRVEPLSHSLPPRARALTTGWPGPPLRRWAAGRWLQTASPAAAITAAGRCPFVHLGGGAVWAAAQAPASTRHVSL
jgi:hypothetical protein